MAFDAFLKIPNINGDSTNDKFAKWITIESFSWGEERPPNGTGIAVPLEVQFVANTQISSPSLFAACANGDALGTVQLQLTAGFEQRTFFKWDLQNAVIGSYRVGGNSADVGGPTEQFSIAFTALTYTYTAQDEKGGVGATVTKTVPFA